MNEAPPPDLTDLEKKFSEWRLNRTSNNQRVPKLLRKLAAKAHQQYDLCDVLMATKLPKARLLSITEEFGSPANGPTKGLSPVSGSRPSSPIVKMSEVHISSLLDRNPQSLIVSIDDSDGRSMKIFSNSVDPTLLIRSFLCPDLEGAK